MNTAAFADAVQARTGLGHQARGLAASSARRVRTDAKASFEEETLSARLASGANTRSFQATIMTKDEPFNIGHTLLPEGPGGRNTIQAINANYH